MKRHINYLIPFLIVCLLVFPALTSCSQEKLYTSTYLDTFDTVLTVTVAASSHTEASEHTQAIHNLLLDLHRQLDIYHHYEGIVNLYDLNHAGGSTVSLSKSVVDVLAIGAEYAGKTDGRLNMCLGALTSLWHDARLAGDHLPDSTEIAEALAHSSPDVLVLDKNNRTARLTDPYASVDVGAIAKGYALSAVKDYADQAGVESLLVNLGGQVLAIGSRPDGKSWSVSIQSPTEQPETIFVRDAVVVTSGADQRLFTFEGKTYHHIIDPITGYPADTYRAVSMVLPLDSLTDSDALSTALFLMPEAEGNRLVTSIASCAVMRVYPDGSIVRDGAWHLYESP